MVKKYMLSSKNLWGEITEDKGELFPGVYRLHGLNEDASCRKLPRLMGEDPDGILYIGASEKVACRVMSMQRSISAAYAEIAPSLYGSLGYDDVGAHQTGKKIAQIPPFIELFPFNRLAVTLHQIEPQNLPNHGHYELEGDLLRLYRAKFGESPPLNN